MANEVIVEEYSSVGLPQSGGGNVPIPGKLLVTQTLSIAAQSAAFSKSTSFIRIQSKGTGFWYSQGATGVDAVAATSPARWLPADQFRDLAIDPTVDVKIDTAA